MLQVWLLSLSSRLPGLSPVVAYVKIFFLKFVYSLVTSYMNTVYLDHIFFPLPLVSPFPVPVRA